MNRSRLGVKLLVAAAIVMSLAAAVGTLIRYSDGAVQIPPGSAWSPDVNADEARSRSAEPEFCHDAPPADDDGEQGAASDDDRDAGVIDAARHYAIQFVTPDLKHPESGTFPTEAIRFERLEILNRPTGGKIQHWFVYGAVDSKNGYGVTVRSPWRIVLGRVDNCFFPVMVMLEEFGIYRFRGHVDMLADARKAAWQERAARDAAEKAKGLAASRAVWQAAEAAKPAEAKAKAALKMAVMLLKSGRTEPARRRLQEVIDQFPDTDAAAEAEVLLKE